MKVCYSCKIFKENVEFTISNREKDKRLGRCKSCSKEAVNKWKRDNPEKAKAMRKKWVDANPDKIEKINTNDRLKRVYGITLIEYEEMVRKQNNLCFICLNPETSIDKRSKKIKRLSVDHCHKTKKIRKLLCQKCNQGLGLFDDNVDILKKAIVYLKYFEELKNTSNSSQKS